MQFLQKLLFRLLHSPLRHSVQIKSFLYRIVYLLPESWRMPDDVRSTLKQIADNKKSVFCVNIGCNDGLAGNPLREFIVTHKWRGVIHLSKLDKAMCFQLLKDAGFHVKEVGGDALVTPAAVNRP